jgi:hypothetical protein
MDALPPLIVKRLRKYGVSVEQFEVMVALRQGRCHLCDEPWVCIDHDHETDHVRGLLCQKCNFILDKRRFEQADWRDRALKYLGLTVDSSTSGLP